MSSSTDVVRIVCDAQHDDERRRLSIPFYRDGDLWQTTMAHAGYRPNDPSLHTTSDEVYGAYVEAALQSPASEELLHEVIRLTCRRAAGCRARGRTGDDRTVRTALLQPLLSGAGASGIDRLPVSVVLRFVGSERKR